MGKRKIALFYDEETESGKQILEFLAPFAKRKSDIVGQLILLWIDEHGTNVPVHWLERSKGELENRKSFFPQRESGAQAKSDSKAGMTVDVEDTKPQGAFITSEERPQNHDVSFIRSGLASFMGV